MKEFQSIITNIKADLLTLYMKTNGQYVPINEYFSVFKQTIFTYFDITNSSFFQIKDEMLIPLDQNLGVNLLDEGIPWSMIEENLQSKKVVDLPSFFAGKDANTNFNQLFLLKADGREPLGAIIFSATPKWLEFYNSEYFDELYAVIVRMFEVIIDSVELRRNETQYRKLYNMTDLFHSTMDIDVILKNVLITIKENFPEFSVELILSNDQDRQTKVQIKLFDYIAERHSTIEAFVSGEITTERASDLECKILNAPIKGRQAIYGILQVTAPLNFVYTEAQKSFIRMLAQASGNALENAQLYHQSHRLITDLQLINETSHRLNSKLNINEMLTYLQKQLDKSFQPMESCFVFKNHKYELTEAVTEVFLNDEGDIYLRHVEKHFELSQDPLFIADFSRLTEEDVAYKSLMAIPMLVEEKIIGYCLVLHKDPYFFSFDSFKLMQSLIHHSSLAISNSFLRSRLQEMVDRDHLTKLYARSFLDRYVENSLEVDDSGMFLLFDIDNFKNVNDSYGHKVGDEVLVQIATQLKMMIGTRGICARWGGEELSVYIPNLLEEEAVKIVSQIVEVIPKITKPSVTISAGFVPWKKADRPEFESVFLHADTALYMAKNNGKNQYCIFNESMQIKSQFT